MNFIKQCKGKDISKIPASKLVENDFYYVSKKYDGNYVQIHKKGDKVKFYTSGAKEFYPIDIADKLMEMEEDFILEAEYIANTDGKLGSRGKCTLTTARTLFSKGLPYYNRGGVFKVFNLIHMDDFDSRINRLWMLDLPKELERVDQITVSSLSNGKEIKDKYVASGYEGAMVVSLSAEYKPGKRVNNVIKLKSRETVDLVCFGVLPGEGKYEGLIGSLQLTDTDTGITVCVGSGLSDKDRHRNPKVFLDKVVEIEYERIDKTYIQPVYKGVRYDKNLEY